MQLCRKPSCIQIKREGGREGGGERERERVRQREREKERERERERERELDRDRERREPIINRLPSGRIIIIRVTAVNYDR